MAKKLSLIVFILLLAGGGYYVYTSSASPEDKVMKKDDSTMMEDTDDLNSMDKMEAEDETDSMGSMDDAEEEGAMMMEDTMVMPETALKFELTEESETMYVAQKRFLSKADEEIVGTAGDVTGEGWIDVDSQELYLAAEVDLTTMSTDSETRDADVLKLLDESTVSVVINSVTDEIALDTPFTTTTVAKVTINGVTKEVTFDVEGTVTESSFTATGTAGVAMSEFGIEAPSLLEVYTVDDELELRFDVTGTVV